MAGADPGAGRFLELAGGIRAERGEEEVGDEGRRVGGYGAGRLVGLECEIARG